MPGPGEAPESKGPTVILTHYVDANLYHNALTGRAVTGIVHYFNQTPFDWYCKKQATVETSTYGAEAVAAQTYIEQIIEIRTMLRYLGVCVSTYSYMFGDNRSVVDSSTVPESKLHRRHNALSYHKVREVISAGYMKFEHLPGDGNPADIISKHSVYRDVWPILRILLFWAGNTAAMTEEDESTTTCKSSDNGECCIQIRQCTHCLTWTSKHTDMSITTAHVYSHIHQYI
jgi:hypothetical protein